MNKIILIGRLGEDPIANHLEGGSVESKFNISTIKSYKNKNGELVEQVEWYKIVAWGKRAEKAEKYLRKGMLIAVIGKSKTRCYEDKDGTTKSITEIISDKIEILSSRPRQDETNAAPKDKKFNKSLDISDFESSTKELGPEKPMKKLVILNEKSLSEDVVIGLRHAFLTRHKVKWLYPVHKYGFGLHNIDEILTHIRLRQTSDFKPPRFKVVDIKSVTNKYEKS